MTLKTLHIKSPVSLHVSWVKLQPPAPSPQCFSLLWIFTLDQIFMKRDPSVSTRPDLGLFSYWFFLLPGSVSGALSEAPLDGRSECLPSSLWRLQAERVTL